MLLKAFCSTCHASSARARLIIRPLLISPCSTSLYSSSASKAKVKSKLDLTSEEGLPPQHLGISHKDAPPKQIFQAVPKVSIPPSSLFPAISAIPPFTTTVPADCLTPAQISIKQTPLKLVNALDGRLLERKKLEVTDIPFYYLSLSKSRLTALVVVTSMAGYALAPAAFNLETFLYLSAGTALTSASANCVNQMIEVPYDSRMDRTKNRVLVNELISIPHALGFALITAGVGLTTLYIGANELTCALGAANLFLYTSVYTPLKRQSILNTWVGSVVGAIPPLMGWAAATGTLDMNSLIIGGILYSWQFVHFNSLSWNLKNDYKRGGYRMMSVTHPDLCRRTALRYSVSLFALCTLAPVLELTTWTFAFDSLPVNGYLTYLAWKFYKDADSSSSRKLFRFSLVHLPALIMLMLISKKWASQKKSVNKDVDK